MQDGFLNGDDDAFDAVVGLFGMLRVCVGERPSGEPGDERIREVEGWILGRQSPTVEHTMSQYSAKPHICSAASEPCERMAGIKGDGSQ
jgi:hypothetical protein